MRRAQRLVLLGMSEDEIAAVEREGKTRPRVTLRAPVSGVIAELGVREGMTVAAGATLFRIAGLGTVWVVAEVPEAQAGMLVPGAQVEARVPAYPEETFQGRVGAILPEVNAATRTVRARVEVANPAGKLKPGMYATRSARRARPREPARPERSGDPDRRAQRRHRRRERWQVPRRRRRGRDGVGRPTPRSARA